MITRSFVLVYDCVRVCNAWPAYGLIRHTGTQLSVSNAFCWET